MQLSSKKGTYGILCHHILGQCPTTPAQKNVYFFMSRYLCLHIKSVQHV